MIKSNKNFSGKIGHFQQCSNSGAFINRKVSSEVKQQKQLFAMSKRIEEVDNQSQVDELKAEVAELKQLVESLLKQKSSNKKEE